MKHTLPWSVSGIPPEARDIARTLAQREGLSVGDWLTRQILAQESEQLGMDTRSSGAVAISNKLSVPDTRDTDDYALRLTRAEREADPAFRRIDESLRSLTRRLENNERAQNEAHRTMNVAAKEINEATRDQSLAFRHLAARIDQAERNTDTGSLREAVRGLHQGLSRLADQIAKMSGESAGQISVLSKNVELLAADIANARAESSQVGIGLEEKIAALTERVNRAEDRIALTSQFETRLRQTEEQIKDSQSFFANPASHLASSNLFAEQLSALEEYVKSEGLRSQETISRHLTSIESTLQNIGERLGRVENIGGSQDDVRDALHELGMRFDASEKKNSETLAALKSSLQANAPFVVPATSTLSAGQLDEQQVSERTPSHDAAAEDPSEPIVTAQTIAETVSIQTVISSEEISRQPLLSSTTLESVPARTSAENYLAQARRAARTAAERNQTLDPRAGFSLRLNDGETPKKTQRLSRVMAIAAAVILLCVAASLLVSRTALENARTVAVSPADAATRVAAKGNAPTVAQASFQPSTAVSPVKPDAQPNIGGEQSQLAARAQNGDAKAALSLGLKYADGDGIEANDTQAVKWLKQAADAGEAIAQYRLGTFYEKGRGVAADPVQAARWYSEAAKGGNRKAMHNLAVALADGAGTAKDMKESAHRFGTAAELGLMDSQFNLAVLYERGLGVKPSLTEAYKWYVIAADAGDMEAKTRAAALMAKLKPTEQVAAEAAAKSYRPQGMNIAANDVQ